MVTNQKGRNKKTSVRDNNSKVARGRRPVVDGTPAIFPVLGKFSTSEAVFIFEPKNASPC